MLEIRPPARADFDSDAAWGRARDRYFKNLPKRRAPEPVIIEKVVEKIVEVPVEVVREVERIVEVPVEVEPEIPEFLRYDPLSEFLSHEQRDGESDEDTLRRLRDEIMDLFALENDGGLTDVEEARKRYLTAHIKPGD